MKRGRGRPRRPVDRYIDDKGYVLVRAGELMYFVGEHRVVMETMIGRALLPGESVHHRNGDRADNRPENLELWVTPPRPGVRGTEVRCPHCRLPWVLQSDLREALSRFSEPGEKNVDPFPRAVGRRRRFARPGPGQAPLFHVDDGLGAA